MSNLPKPPDTSDILTLLRSVNAIITHDHFVYTSGKHGSGYINKDALYPHSTVTSQVCYQLAQLTKHLDIDTVVAPALGGIILSQWLSHHLSILKGKEIFGVYAEKDPSKGFVFTRGYDQFVTHKKVLAVEDLTTTGGSVKKIVEVVREQGGEVAGVCVMVNRNPAAVNASLFGTKFIAGADIQFETYDESECPLCQAQVPINTTVGHGKKYVQSHPASKR